MRLFKSPIGIAIIAVIAVLAVSPEARKTARRWAVKGTSAVLDLIDQARESTHHLIEEARHEHSLPAPEHSNTFEDKNDIYNENFVGQK